MAFTAGGLVQRLSAREGSGRPAASPVPPLRLPTSAFEPPSPSQPSPGPASAHPSMPPPRPAQPPDPRRTRRPAAPMFGPVTVRTFLTASQHARGRVAPQNPQEIRVGPGAGENVHALADDRQLAVALSGRGHPMARRRLLDHDDQCATTLKAGTTTSHTSDPRQGRQRRSAAFRRVSGVCGRACWVSRRWARSSPGWRPGNRAG
jgi:hypothetical protein